MGAELLELGLEQLTFLIGGGFFVQDQDIANVVVVYLQSLLAAFP